MMSGDLPILAVADPASWGAWLEAHGSSSPRLWMKLAKSGATSPTLTQTEAIEGALCHGWIDGQLGKLEAEHFLIRFTPRRPQSRWSAVNHDRAQRLIESGRMRETGFRAIEAAEADGR